MKIILIDILVDNGGIPQRRFTQMAFVIMVSVIAAIVVSSVAGW